jgi:hypothetical protein
MPAAEDDVAAARTGAVRQERGQRLLRTLEAKLTELAQEVADLARERKEETPGDFDSLWEAFCYHISRSQPSDFANYEDRIRALCQDVMRDLGEGRFTSQLLAICTPECVKWTPDFGPVA